LDSRKQAAEYLQEVKLATSSPQVQQFNHILPVIGGAIFAMTSMMCGGLILIARLHRIQREKKKKMEGDY
jgi:ABC-type dipeptide/oligopeptide/nickel transport system permease subunit